MRTEAESLFSLEAVARRDFVIETNGLTRYFGGKKAVDGITMGVPAEAFSRFSGGTDRAKRRPSACSWDCSIRRAARRVYSDARADNCRRRCARARRLYVGIAFRVQLDDRTRDG